MNITNIANKEDKKLPKIKVIGVGGGGANAVNYMYSHELVGVDFIVCDTDKQALENSQVPNRLIIGELLTGGRGLGPKPEIGEKAAVESTEAIKDMIGTDTDMIFIIAGMGGATGTGASPIIAKLAKDLGILTVTIVITPYRFEGPKRAMHAEIGIEELRNNVDALIIVSNENLKNHYKSTSTSEVYRIVNEVLLTSVRAIINIIKGNGTVNIDFDDLKTIMQNKGFVFVSEGRGKGENRALDAMNKLLDYQKLISLDIKGSKSMLVNIATHPNNKHTYEELETVMTCIDSAVGHFDADKINGESDDVTIGEDEFVVTVIATDFDASNYPEPIAVYGDNAQPGVYKQQIGTQQPGGYNRQVSTQQPGGYNQSPQISAYNTNNNQVSSWGMVLTDNDNVIDAITENERIRKMLKQRNQADFMDKSIPAYNRR